ncbi:MAG: plastocyanin/azurin family copper-binding protein [Pirellulaceae bacterium]
MRLRLLLAVFTGFICSQFVHGQHQHGETTKVAAPTVFLDKSPRVVEYQLKRLSNEQLLAIETATDDKKYIPVLTAILARDGMPAANRIAALDDLVAINRSNAVVELSSAIASIKGNDDVAQRTRQTLAGLLLASPVELLGQQQMVLEELAANQNPQTMSVGLAALIAAGVTDKAFAAAEQSEAAHEQLWRGVRMFADPGTRSQLHSRALTAIETDQPLAVRRAAIAALATIPVGRQETFLRVSEFLEDDDLRPTAVQTLLSLPANAAEPKRCGELVAWLVNFAEATPAAERTSDSFVDAMQLVDQLIAKIPPEQAAEFRNRLRETVVRVVRVRTVEEEMRYDIPYFAVEAGRPVQVVLINQDMMPHNLVVTQPGALKEIAELGMQVGPAGGASGKQYVPDSDKVLFATQMVAAHEQEALTFTAPTTPGEYPYVCTFPRHWMRMYGVMVVVENLDAWLKNPTEPTDPVGSNRSFVQSWTIKDFAGKIDTGLRGRTPEIGKRLFVEASCAQCHKAGDLVSGNVGPELGKVLERWKGNTSDVLLEILDPAHRIDPKYVVQLLLTDDDETISGLVIAETDDTISILDNPEAKEPRVVSKDEIVAQRRTSTSMMPKGLLDRFSEDEIFEILAFIQSIQEK